jgi:hypothetical protein
MAIRQDENIISLVGHCAIEEAESLFEALRATEDPIFDLAEATSLHTAIVQIIMASSGKVRGVIANPVLAACLRERTL